MKSISLGIAACFVACHAWAAAGGQQAYGNALVTGSDGCAVVQGTFPTEASFTTGTTVAGASTNVYYLKILLQNPTIGLPLQYLTAVVGPSPTLTVYDPQLFNTFAGLTGTYTGQPVLQASGNIKLDGGGTPLVFSSQIPNGGGTCVLSLTGLLYFSPD